MPQLKKNINISKGIVLAISMVIGSGLLSLPGLAFQIGNFYETGLSWILIIFAVIPLIHIFTSLGTRYASAAGLTKYVEEAIGKWGAYSVTLILLGTFSLGIPALIIIGAEYIQKIFNVFNIDIALIAIVLLLIITVLNIKGIKIMSIVNTISFCIVILIVIGIIIFNLDFFVIGIKFCCSIPSNFHNINYKNTWQICALLFWAFLGWENLSFGLEEFNNPKRSIPIVYWGSFIIVSILYLLLAFTSIGAMINGVNIRGASGLIYLVESIPFSDALIFSIILLILANANSWVFGASRLIHSSAKQKMLPIFFERLSKNGMPLNSIILILVVSSLVIIVTDLFNIKVSSLLLLVNQNFLCLFGLCILAYFKIEQSNKKWFFSLTSLVSLGFLISGFSWWILYPVVLFLLGIIFYFIKLKVVSEL